MANDNDFILSHGLDHQVIANILRKTTPKYLECDLTVKMFKTETTRYKGCQDSPFEDNTYTNAKHTVTNLENGEKIEFSGLLIDMIGRYGFYEGKGTSYRLEPSSILKVFGTHIFDWATNDPEKEEPFMPIMGNMR